MRYRRVGARTGGWILSTLSRGNIIWDGPLWATPHPGSLFLSTILSVPECLSPSIGGSDKEVTTTSQQATFPRVWQLLRARMPAVNLLACIPAIMPEPT